MDVRPVRSQSVTLNSSVGERSRRSRTDGNETTTETKQRPFPYPMYSTDTFEGNLAADVEVKENKAGFDPSVMRDRSLLGSLVGARLETGRSDYVANMCASARHDRQQAVDD